MNKFQLFREARRYTQQQVAEMLHTTQQTVARWESGKAEPDLVALKNLAFVYDTSVDDILGCNPFSSGVVTNSHFSLDGSRERFWGHVGVGLFGEKFTRWFPITEAREEEIRRAIAFGSVQCPFFTVATLNNRLLVINFLKVRHIYLLDDNADQIQGDWQLDWDSYQGFSVDIYRALAAIAMWGPGEEGGRFEANPFQMAVRNIIEKEGLTEAEITRRVLKTNVYFETGGMHAGMPKMPYILNFLQGLEVSVDLTLDLSEADVGLSMYIPTNNISLIELPLYQVIDALKNEFEEDRSDSMSSVSSLNEESRKAV